MKSGLLNHIVSGLKIGQAFARADMNLAIADGLKKGDIILRFKFHTPEVEGYLERVRQTLILMLELPEQGTN